MKIDKSDCHKNGRRQTFKCLAWCALGFLLFSGRLLQSREVQRQTVTKMLEPKTEKSACPDDSIVPNIKPRWKTGQTLRYQTTKAEAKPSSLPGTTTGNSGEVALRSEPIPLRQTITVGENGDFDGENCVSIEREGLVENPVPSMAGQSSGGGSKDQSKSYLSAEGKIRSCESRTTVTDGQSASVSTNRMSGFTATSDLHYFYGYWMLALAPDFSWECLKNTSEGSVFHKLKVSGMETINGRECFVVERTYRTEFQGSQLTRYWVDKENRIAVQVKKGNYTIRLVS
jgi:hypothetical protein